MKIAVGSDHRGFSQKNVILQFFMQDDRHVCIDIGTFTDERTDYPIYAQKAVSMIGADEVDAAILLCGSGIGMAIAANRHRHIRAGVVWNKEVAYIARAHDNVNVLVIPSDFVAHEQVVNIIESWLQAQFLNGRYALRLDMIDEK